VIPAHWTRYRAFDYGLDMLAALWLAVDETGRSYLYRELNLPGLIVSEAAAAICDHTTPGEIVAATFAPPDLQSRQKDTGKTMSELFFTGGVPIATVKGSRVQGWLLLKELLADRPDGAPGLLVFDTCRTFITNILAIQADEANPNDCATEPHDITHNLDAARYFAVSRTLPGRDPKPDASVRDLDDPEEYDGFMTGGELGSDYLNF
jgi:phage terminase large subunit